MSTREVFDRHFQAFKDQDMETMMADYSEDSLVVTADGTFRGLDEIREMFAASFDEFSGEYFVEAQDVVVEDNVAFFTWRADNPENFYEFGADTFIIEDGVIKYQTIAAVAYEK